MKKLLVLFLVVIVIILGSGRSIFSPPSGDAAEKIFVIAKGEGVNEISEHLKERDFIKNKFVFEVYVWLKNAQSKFQAGEHKLRQNMSVLEIAKILTSSKPTEEADIKIIEGWNNREIAEYLEGDKIINEDEFLDGITRYGLRVTGYDFLGDRPEGATLEGYLFPDTYRIYKEIPKDLRGENDGDAAMAEHIIKKMLDNFDKKMTQDLREEIARQKKTIFEIITMASIVEKEARSQEDKKIVADIFWRRLKAGMPLQSDATVNYATGKYETRPSLDDLGEDSLYNTYKYPGLPKGPIGNPGIEAIRAAIYPEANNFWYFLTAKDGKMIYSKNFDEHLENTARYLE